MQAFSERLSRVEERIQRACDRAGRRREEVRIVAVTKTHPVDVIRLSLAHGLIHIGESRWQEAEPKVSEVGSGAVWHFIGRLQSNKARRIGETFDWIHSLSTVQAARELAKSGRTIRCFVQVDPLQDGNKSGIIPAALDKFLDDVAEWPQVEISGLMTIGPLVSDPDDARPIFSGLADLARSRGLERLSMGMSGDFEAAILEGATDIRLGSILFGDRG